ncbi:hypothetical protein IGI04_024056 [Brassica rapa subsp. trilocularis]|uniref:DUF4283 domain-containing protein n=1 Tax=Brassica rapa subsp. trilocularis TaxID=1813537 RepID=A0ABQ7M7R5_BRACM|nr:hypothetical protein IGI04_024056 [Brassica rapa subsp. trilocularis]
MQNRWALTGHASAAKPPSPTSGNTNLPPPHPPDPPDPSSSLSPVQFPPLSSTPPKSRSELRRSHLTLALGDSTKSLTTSPPTKASLPELAPRFGSFTEIESQITIPATGNPCSLVATHTTHPTSNPLKVLLPKHNSPLITNRASLYTQTSNHKLPVHSPVQNPDLPTNSNLPSNSLPSIVTPNLPPIFQSPPVAALPTLAEKLRVKGDKTLQRLAPITMAESGRPRVLIPDSVFQKGAELHKDFIICYFNGRPPPFNQIQSVLNHMWGKGRRLEIHNSPLQRSAIVRIQSEFLREKILDKNIWYIGDSMFHTAQWSSEHSSSTPPLSAIKIWSHLTGVPLDLRYQQGLSLVAGLIGDPKETDDFTLNLVSLTLSHVKVEVDLTKPLPTVVEFERQSGEVVEVKVDYPWLPPTCSHCHELGHVIRNCLHYSPPKDAPAPATTESIQKQKPKGPESSKKTPAKAQKNKHYVPIKRPPPPSTPPVLPPPITPSNSISLPSSPSAFKPPLFFKSKTFIPPLPSMDSPSDKPPKPSLKRCRSSPSLSPPVPLKPPFQNSNPINPPPPLFPVIGTVQYIENSSFIGPSFKNSFLPLLTADTLQSPGEPLFSS